MQQFSEHGTAKWMEPHEAVKLGLYDGQGIIIGDGSQGFLRYSGNGHVLMVAPPGAGKGIGFVLPNCLTHPGSLVVVDPKGENAKHTAQHRAAYGYNVQVLDPYGVTGFTSAAYNPLSWVHQTYADPVRRPHFVAEINAVAEALIVPEGGDAGGHFSALAQNMIANLMIKLVTETKGRDATLFDLFDLLALSITELDDLFNEMAVSEHPDTRVRRIIRQGGNWWGSIDEKQQSNILTTVSKNLAFLKDWSIEPVVSSSSFDMRQLRGGRLTIYLSLPFTYVKTMRPWLRVMLTMGLLALLSEASEVKPPVLFLVDEWVAGVGRLDLIERAIPTVRGYGGRFAFVIQGLQFLEEMYPNQWEGILNTMGAQIYCRVNNLREADYISRRLGNRTILGAGSTISHGHLMAQPLLTPDQVMQFPREIVFLQNEKPLQCATINCWTDNRLRGGLA